jgi:hypothetical protein
LRRAFWVSLGLGAGAASAILVSRWTKRQAQRVAPATIARETKGGIVDLSRLVSESIAEGRRAMDERERGLRAAYDATDEPGAGAPDAHAGDPTRIAD